MAQFMIYCLDKPGALDLRMANRPAHLDWAAGEAERILMAGPLFKEDGETFAGSCFLIEAESLQAARDWSAQDPYVKADLFERVDVRPFRWAIGAGKRSN